MIVAVENATQRWIVTRFPCSTTSDAWCGPEPAQAEPTKGPKGESAIADPAVVARAMARTKDLTLATQPIGALQLMRRRMRVTSASANSVAR